MRKSKLFLLLLILCFVFGMAACAETNDDGTNDDNTADTNDGETNKDETNKDDANKDETNKDETIKDEHTHTFSDEWSKDEQYHWHAATCEHETEVSGKVEHEYETVVTEPTCTADGYTTYTCVCGDTYQDDVVIANHVMVYDYQNGEIYCSGCDTQNETIEKSTTYGIAGSFNGWNNAGDIYVVNEDVIRLDIELEAGLHEFKITKKGSWDNAFGLEKAIAGNNLYKLNTYGGNVTFELTEKKLVSIIFNTKGATLQVLYNGEFAGDLPLSVIGVGGDWNTDHEMTYQGNGLYTCQVEVTANTEYKIRQTGGWTLSFGLDFAIDGANILLEVTEAATYTFTIDFFNLTITATPSQQ